MQNEERKTHTVYGIEAVSPEGKILLGFSDIFFDRQKAEHFVYLCNDGRLSLFHLPYAVEEALAEQM